MRQSTECASEVMRQSTVAVLTMLQVTACARAMRQSTVALLTILQATVCVCELCGRSLCASDAMRAVIAARVPARRVLTRVGRVGGVDSTCSTSGERPASAHHRSRKRTGADSWGTVTGDGRDRTAGSSVIAAALLTTAASLGGGAAAPSGSITASSGRHQSASRRATRASPRRADDGCPPF